MIPLVGWRSTYALLGLMLLLGMAPVGGLLVRNQPEAYGLQPDGAAPSDRESETHPVLSWSGEHWTLAEAVRAPGCWVLAAGFASMSLLSTGLTFHIVSIYVDNGLTPTIAASAFVPMAMTSAGTGPPRSGLGTATETGARSLTPWRIPVSQVTTDSKRTMHVWSKLYGCHFYSTTDFLLYSKK